MDIVRQFNSPACATHTMICLPHAGGGTSRYRSWVLELEPYTDVLIPVLPGRENRFLEPAHMSVSNSVDEILAALKGKLNKPVYICGISYGALIAYELALALEEQNVAIEGLYIASQRSPCFESELRHWHGMSDLDLINNLQELGGIDTEAMDPEVLSLFMGTIRTDLKASDDYLAIKRPKLSCPIQVLWGTQDPVIERRHIERWHGKSEAPVHLNKIDSGHFLMKNDVDLWLQFIKNDIAAKTP